MIFSKCSVCNSNKSTFIKEQEAGGILSSIGIKLSMSQNSFVRSYFILKCKTNEIINKFLLAGDKFMSEVHLKQTGFTYGACDPFTKNKEIIKKM